MFSVFDITKSYLFCISTFFINEDFLSWLAWQVEYTIDLTTILSISEALFLNLLCSSIYKNFVILNTKLSAIYLITQFFNVSDINIVFVIYVRILYFLKFIKNLELITTYLGIYLVCTVNNCQTKLGLVHR